MTLIRVAPAPSCPKCGARMILRRPRPGDEWKPFWGCGDYPTCDGTLRPVTKAEGQETLWPEEGVRYENL